MGYAQASLTAVGQAVTDSTEFTTGGAYTIELTGSSGNTFVAEASEDFSAPFTWTTVAVIPVYTGAQPPAPQTSFTGDGLYTAQVENTLNFRIRCTAFTGSATTCIISSGGTAITPTSVNSYVQNFPTDGSGNLKVAIQSGSSGLSAASYKLISASGNTNWNATVLYGVYNPAGAALLQTFTLKDGTSSGTTIIPSNTILSSAPFASTYGPAGIALANGQLTANLGGVITNPILVVYR